MVKTISVPKSFIVFDRTNFKKGHPVNLNDQESIITKVTDLKNGKYRISVKKK